MRSLVFGIVVLSAGSLIGCDNITGFDNYDPPESLLVGRVVYDGVPVGVRSTGVQLELWQPGPEFELNTKITVTVDQDGSFSAMLFDGSYEINLLENNGPWVSNTTRIPVEVSGETSIDIPVVPYALIRDETLSYNAGAGAGGTVQASFTVDRIDSSRAIEYVGLYVGTTAFVDRNLGLNISNAERERSGAAIQEQVTAGTPITISVALPDDIHETPSPERRNHVFARIGVKTVGVAEMHFSPVHRIDI